MEEKIMAMVEITNIEIGTEKITIEALAIEDILLADDLFEDVEVGADGAEIVDGLDFAGGLSGRLFCGDLGGGGGFFLLTTAGSQGQDHHSCQQQRKHLFHIRILQKLRSGVPLV